MTRSNVTLLVLRLFAIFLWLVALLGLSNLGFFLGDWSGLGENELDRSTVTGLWISIGFTIGLGLLLFALAPALARRMFPGDALLDSGELQHVGVLALQIAGVLLWNHALARAGSITSFLAHTHLGADWTRFDIQVGCTLGLVLAGWACFFRADALARALFRTSATPQRPAAAAHIARAAFAVVGISILAKSTPELAVQLSAAGSSSFSWTSVRANESPLTEALRVLLGLALVFGSGPIASFWHWARHAGLDARERKA